MLGDGGVTAQDHQVVVMALDRNQVAVESLDRVHQVAGKSLVNRVSQGYVLFQLLMG